MKLKNRSIVRTTGIWAIMLSSMFVVIRCSQSSDNTQSTKKETVNPTESAESSKTTAETKSNDPLQNKGIGPIKDLKLGELNEEMVATGKKIYEVKCIACHNISEKLIGPPQAGVLKRRSPEWVMNLMLNPEEMLKKDPIAIELLKEYNNIPMTNQQLTEEEARAILEFFRTI